MFGYILMGTLLAYACHAVNMYPPTWVTSPYIKSACYDVIAVLTGNSSTPTATIPFPGAAFTAIPNFGYGAFMYQGSDPLQSEQFEINRTGVTTSSFSVLVQISGFTNIKRLNVRFIAIDAGFPHHVNCFDNVPANYSAGPLVNISDGTTHNMQVYRNVINFTHQSNALAYNHFTTPLTNHKILFFLTTFFHEGHNENASQTNTSLWNPVTFTVDYVILTNQTYELTVHLGVYNRLIRLHFSQVIFDSADVESSGLYMLIYERINFDHTGGFFHIPSEFVDNFMLGMTNFTTIKCRSIIYFTWSFETINGVFGLFMPVSVPANPVHHYGFTYLYIKTWICPNNTYFDPAYNLCSECPIVNCMNCFNISVCQLCDFVNGYIANLTTGLCQKCSLPNCTTCEVSNLTMPATQHCTVCDTQNNYHLVGGICEQCLVSAQYFLNTTTMQCQLCAIPNCIVCHSLTQCTTCDYNHSYGILTNHTCQYCNNSDNIFINLTTQQCVLCAIPHCLICSSLTACSTCDQNANYFLNSSTLGCDHCTPSNCFDCLNMTACSVCSGVYLLNSTTQLCEICTLANCSVCLTLSTCSNCSSGFLMNPNTSLCETCTIPNCLTCLSLTACSICNNSAGYFLNLTTGLCQPCSLLECLTCATLTSCSICNNTAAYFLNSTSQLCQPCSLSNCLTCASLTSCSVCNTSAEYLLNSTSQLCESCAVANCLTCATHSTCSVCNNSADYFLTGALQCELCSLTGCFDCLNMTACSVCSGVYLLNSTTQLCEICTLANCSVCLTLSTCSNCSSGFLMNPNTSLCETCTIPNCLTCLSLAACSICDNSTGYFLNSTSQICDLCTVANCLTCANLISCSICDVSNGFYLNSTSLLCEPCAVTNCLTCATLNTCSVCNEAADYFLNGTLQCQLCSLTNCSKCQNLTACSVCDISQNSVLNYTTGLCEFCSLEGCLTCAEIDFCSVCDLSNNYGADYTSPNNSLCGSCNVSCVCDGYTLPWDQTNLQCSSLCGDGFIRVDEECDDGNNLSYDGCSSSCRVQPYSVCSGEPSLCNKTLQFAQQYAKIKKEGCNQLSVTIEQNQLLVAINEIQFLHDGITAHQVSLENNNIKIIASFSQTLVNQKIDVKVGQKIFSTQIQPLQPLLYYSEQQCRTAESLNKLVDGIAAISYIVLILSVISCKIIGLELFGVLQLTYFSLISYDFLSLYMEPLAKFKIFNGLNIPIVEQPQQPSSLSYLSFSTNILNNCNIMFFVMVGELIISLSVCFIGTLSSRSTLKQFGLKMLKQGFITILIFNIFNLSFSAGAHLKFAEYNQQAYTEGVVLIVICVVLCVMAVMVFFFSSETQYGQFIDKFKDTSVCKIYIMLELLFRVVIGVYCSTHSEQIYSTLIILAFSFAFILYCIVNLPFNSTAENYRSCLIHVTELVILLVANYYRSMKANTPIQIKGYIFGPVFLVFGLVVVCVAGSLVRLIYEIYTDVLKICQKKRINHHQNSLQNSTQMTLQNVN